MVLPQARGAVESNLIHNKRSLSLSNDMFCFQGQKNIRSIPHDNSWEGLSFMQWCTEQYTTSVDFSVSTFKDSIATMKDAVYIGFTTHPVVRQHGVDLTTRRNVYAELLNERPSKQQKVHHDTPAPLPVLVVSQQHHRTARKVTISSAQLPVPILSTLEN